jgi:putative heme-binding domain-containing protein
VNAERLIRCCASRSGFYKDQAFKSGSQKKDESRVNLFVGICTRKFSFGCDHSLVWLCCLTFSLLDVVLHEGAGVFFRSQTNFNSLVLSRAQSRPQIIPLCEQEPVVSAAGSPRWNGLARLRGFVLATFLLCEGFAAITMFSNRAFAQEGNRTFTAAEVMAGAATFAANCQLCHGANGDSVAGIDLAHQRFKRAASDDDLRGVIHDGVPAAGMPSFPTLTRADQDGLVAYIRSNFNQGGSPSLLGDRTRGRALFEGKGGCAGCHRPGGNGSASDLSFIGAVRLPADIQKAILDPNMTLLPINRAVHIVTKSGRTYDGQRVNEDTFTVELLDRASRRPVLIERSDIRDYRLAAISDMPAYAGKLTDQEVADLMAYLLPPKEP